MQWEGRQESENVEDRRGVGLKTGIAVGGGGLLIVILALVLGVDPQQLGQIFGPGNNPNEVQKDGQQKGPVDPAEERLAKFSKVIFHDTETVWTKLFSKMGKTYQKPTLVLFTGRVESACGAADAAVGPFYCPGDSHVYIDLSFYKDMEKKLNAPGEFARAYVIAHEVGHHVQRLLGYSQQLEEARRTQSKVEANHASVRLELQADYLAGVWAHHGQREFKFLDAGDIDGALNAAKKIGDDYLQKKSRGVVVPDAFTHGKSEQRSRWFKKGFDTGDVEGARELIDLLYERL